jgi:Txe/YoeB family toxin of Txe-Axe toxin-antitoxin module
MTRLKRINTLIEDISIYPYEGLGKPKPHRL